MLCHLNNLNRHRCYRDRMVMESRTKDFFLIFLCFGKTHVVFQTFFFLRPAQFQLKNNKNFTHISKSSSVEKLEPCVCHSWKEFCSQLCHLKSKLRLTTRIFPPYFDQVTCKAFSLLLMKCNTISTATIASHLSPQSLGVFSFLLAYIHDIAVQ